MPATARPLPAPPQPCRTAVRRGRAPDCGALAAAVVAVSGLLGGGSSAAAAETLRVAGPVEVVYDWSRDRCRDDTIPDLAARAFRDRAGRVQLLLSHAETVRMVGADFDSLKVRCTPVARSTGDQNPARFADNEWIAAPYTHDGVTVHALVHNEHQGHRRPAQCPSADYFKCWYNTITLAVSRDGGDSYAHARPPPEHLVAALPRPYVPDGGPFGMFSPSNIVKAKDGFFYAFVKAETYLTRQQYSCLMRTGDLSDPKSWRFWDGRAFAGTFVDPYRDPGASRTRHTCTGVAPNDIGAMTESLTFNTYLNRYVLVGVSADTPAGREIWGFYVSFSDDLIHWSRRQLLMEVPLPWTAARPDMINYLYPALIDPASGSRNFETTGRSAYLYYTRNNRGHTSLDRDLLRVKVEFFTK